VKSSLAVLLAMLLAPSLWALSLPPGWDFGSTRDETPVSGIFTATNDETAPLTFRLISPCDCLTVHPPSLTLPPGKSARFTVRFDPKGYGGPVEKPVLVKVAGGVDRLFTVTGRVVTRSGQVPDYPECEWCRKQSAEVRRQAYESWRRQPSVVHYYYSPECRSCTEFLSQEVPRVGKLLGRVIEVDRLDVGNPSVLQELDALLARKKLTLTALPVLVAHGAVLVGEKAIREGFEREMQRPASP
jgi:hypothetical protein